MSRYKENDENILVHQLAHFQTYLDRLGKQFLHLSIKRVQTKNMTRDEYIMYDTLDSIIHLVSALDEVVGKKEPYPSYVVEKMKTVQSYVDTCVKYFEAREAEVRKNAKEEA